MYAQSILRTTFHHLLHHLLLRPEEDVSMFSSMDVDSATSPPPPNSNPVERPELNAVRFDGIEDGGGGHHHHHHLLLLLPNISFVDTLAAPGDLNLFTSLTHFLQIHQIQHPTRQRKTSKVNFNRSKI